MVFGRRKKAQPQPGDVPFSSTEAPTPLPHVNKPAVVRRVDGPQSPLMDETRLQKLRTWLDKAARTSPSRLAVGVFGGIILLITLLLSLPFATQADVRAPLVDIFFTAVSAVCVTGLTVVDTATYWSHFGQAVIALGIAIGGLGVMTLASIMGLIVSRHIGLTQRMLTAEETKIGALGKVGTLIRGVIMTSVVAEAVLFVVYLPRFLQMDLGLLEAVWQALFMSISVFNNAGFVIMVGGLTTHVGDWWMLMPIALGGAVGAIGFPVITDISQRWRTPRRWNLHTKLTLSMYLALAVIGSLLLALTEWTNPETLGDLDSNAKLLNVIVGGVNTRSSGLSALDVGTMRPQTHFIQDMMMFIGGGSASTAGGIKVSTFAVLVLAVLAEARGDRDIEAFERRIPSGVVRLAVAVMLLGMAMVSVSVIVLLMLTQYSLDVVMFEVVSAFATVGLSTGITETLPDLGKIMLALLMFAGRTGTMTVATALAIRDRRNFLRMPPERPVIG